MLFRMLFRILDRRWSRGPEYLADGFLNPSAIQQKQTVVEMNFAVPWACVHGIAKCQLRSLPFPFLLPDSAKLRQGMPISRLKFGSPLERALCFVEAFQFGKRQSETNMAFIGIRLVFERLAIRIHGQAVLR